MRYVLKKLKIVPFHSEKDIGVTFVTSFTVYVNLLLLVGGVVATASNISASKAG